MGGIIVGFLILGIVFLLAKSFDKKPSTSTPFRGSSEKGNRISQSANYTTEFTINQRMSIMNLLTVMAICDGESGNLDEEIERLNSYVDILQIRGNDSRQYFEVSGHQQMLKDLSYLTSNQQAFLVSSVYDIIRCDGVPSSLEMNSVNMYLSKIGIFKEELKAAFEKHKNLERVDTKGWFNKFYRGQEWQLKNEQTRADFRNKMGEDGEEMPNVATLQIVDIGNFLKKKANYVGPNRRQDINVRVFNALTDWHQGLKTKTDYNWIITELNILREQVLRA